MSCRMFHCRVLNIVRHVSLNVSLYAPSGHCTVARYPPPIGKRGVAVLRRRNAASSSGPERSLGSHTQPHTQQGSPKLQFRSKGCIYSFLEPVSAYYRYNLRMLGNCWEITVRQNCYEIVGRICMDDTVCWYG